MAFLNTDGLKRLLTKIKTVVDEINTKFDDYVKKDHPVVTGSFSLGRKDETTVGNDSVAEGVDVTASAAGSHAEGIGTTAASEAQHAEGKDNVPDANGAFLHIVGNGTAESPSNAFAVEQDGTGRFGGDLYVNAESDSTGGVKVLTESRVTALHDSPITQEIPIESAGIPEYISDVTKYPEFNLTDTGWYVFARITAKAGVEVSNPTCDSDAYAYTAGNNYIDVAVRFEVAAMSKVVTVQWAEGVEESFVFRSTDLAIQNLDYRVTFYVYDADDYIRWEYAYTTDTTFAADKTYYTKENGEYEQATVVAGESVPVYYERSFALTTDTTFVEGTTYYTLVDDEYVEATVTAGEEVPADTYYVAVYTRTTDEAFQETKTYYVLSDGQYIETYVTYATPVPAYYNHSKCIIEGLVRNITYKLDQIIDCPMEFILPEIEDETHGCWFEIRCRHAGEYSMTLTPPSSDVLIATEHTQRETAGINMINLHYTVVDGLKIWRFMNTHSSIPTTTT